MIAIRENHIEIVEILLDVGANVNFRNKTGVTPLMVASNDIVHGRNVIVLELLKRGFTYMFEMMMVMRQLI